MARKLIFAPLLIAVLFSVTGCSKKEQHNMSNEIDENLPPIVSFCSSIDYSDTASLHTDGEMAEHMATIVKHMTRSDSTDISRALEIFFKGLGSDGVSLRSAARHANLYLYNPASPVRDETLYILFLKSLLNNSGIPTDISDKAKEQLHWAMLNRPGTIATDFRYIDRDGNQGTLHSLSSRQTMLVFYDPECPHCPAILQKIARDPKVNAAINANALKVLAIYAEGKRDVWEKTKSEMPSKWTVGYDLSDILDNDLYDLPAMPIVYLLDGEKRVIIKDMQW